MKIKTNERLLLDAEGADPLLTNQLIRRIQLEDFGSRMLPEGADTFWNLERVKAREALRKLPTIPGPGGGRTDWNDVRVAHLDTGVTRHPALGFGGGTSSFVHLDSGMNFMEKSTLPLDPLGYGGGLGDAPGHGTRTASVLCGSVVGQYQGAAPRVDVIPYRVTNSVVIQSRQLRAHVAAAIDHAVNVEGCTVVSISLGALFLSPFDAGPLQRAVDDAYEKGVIIVCAAGQVIDRVVYPAKFSRTIAVGGINYRNTVYQRYGDGWESAIDSWAPADPVYRANVEQTESGLNYGYGYGDGTSFATPHVAATAAMWLAFHRRAIDLEYMEPWQRIEAFRHVLERSKRPIDGGYPPAGSRSGLLDAELALDTELPDAADLEISNEAVNEWA